MDSDLLKIARNAIKKYLNLPYNKMEVEDDWLIRRATFVTITKKGELRGCIGSLEAVDTLVQDIEQNAIAACFKDRRFPPLQADELDDIKIEISILTPIQVIKFKTEGDILNKIVPFKMGLLLEYGIYRGTFLPQVWEYYPKPVDFFNHLKLKAGLDSNFFNDKIKLYYYEVEKCRE